MSNTKLVFAALKARAKEQRDAEFLAEVERRAGARRDRMRNATADKDHGCIYSIWLRRILGEKP